jgi:hypothetical protein
MKKKTLFPISLNNNLFSTEKVSIILGTLSQEYEEIFFIVADEIQLYNQAANVKNATDLSAVIKQFYSGRSLLDQRRIWLQKMMKQIFSKSEPNWTILGFDDIADQSFSRIYRNVLILFHTDNHFQNDVRNDAINFIQRKENSSLQMNEKNIGLSVSYILEEIAASVRLHVGYEIWNEHYMGHQLRCIVNLYAGIYSTNIFSLAGSDEKEDKCIFYELNPESKKWFEILSKSN